MVEVKDEKFTAGTHGNAGPPDTAEFVAELILKAVITGEPEIYARDWMQHQK
jgi:hypothetical protein